MYFFDINYTLMKIMVHVYLLREKFTYIRVHLISSEMKTTTARMHKRTKLGIYKGERDSSSQDLFSYPCKTDKNILSILVKF